MEGFLPVPTRPPVVTHLPSEVLLRFSTVKPKGQYEAFLHGLAATATFGKDFGASAVSGLGTGMGIGMAPVLLKRPKHNLDGCNAFPSSDIAKRGKKGESNAPTFIVDRGSCTFFRKAYNAKAAGAGGVIILGYPPPVSSPATDDEHQQSFGADEVVQISPDQEGLIRPSAEEESEYMIEQLGAEFGVLYLQHLVGGPILDQMKLGDVAVEMFDLDRSGGGAGSGGQGGEEVTEATRGTRRGHADKAGLAGRQGREGRVMVAGWDIWNLRIVERPP